ATWASSGPRGRGSIAAPARRLPPPASIGCSRPARCRSTPSRHSATTPPGSGRSRRSAPRWSTRSRLHGARGRRRCSSRARARCAWSASCRRSRKTPRDAGTDMLLYLTQYLTRFESGFNVFNYLTLRAILGALTALVLSFVIGPRMIARLSMNQSGQPVREYGPSTHLPKAGTPTMGGALILTSIVVSTLLWADLQNRFVWIVLFVTLAFGIIGYVDDYKKLVLQDPKGLSPRQKLFWQSAVGLAAAVSLYVLSGGAESASLLIPYFKDLALPLGPFQIAVSFFFIVGFSNAVNLTDGLDGLAIIDRKSTRLNSSHVKISYAVF